MVWHGILCVEKKVVLFQWKHLHIYVVLTLMLHARVVLCCGTVQQSPTHTLPHTHSNSFTHALTEGQTLTHTLPPSHTFTHALREGGRDRMRVCVCVRERERERDIRCKTFSWACILIYQGVHHCTKVCYLRFTDCKGSNTTWEFKIIGLRTMLYFYTNDMNCFGWWNVAGDNYNSSVRRQKGLSIYFKQ